MSLKELIENFGGNLTEPQVMSYRYLDEMYPLLKDNDWGEYKEDAICGFEGNNPIHLLPKRLKDSMSPLTRTAYETIKEAMGFPLWVGYSWGRFIRENTKAEPVDSIALTSFDNRVYESLSLGHGGHAATELYFFKFGTLSSILDKTLGYSLGLVLSPIAFTFGFAVSPKV